MRVEFAFRTYSTFGPNATLALAGTWLEKRLELTYGSNIKSILVEACCKNVSPARKTLAVLNETFEKWINTLPTVELAEKGTELRLCFKALGYTHDEVRRDAQVLSVKTFQQVVGKAADLVELVPIKLPTLSTFNASLLGAHLRAARSETPRTLDELIELHRSHRQKNAT